MIIKRTSLVYKLLTVLPYSWSFYQILQVRVEDDFNTYVKIKFGFPTYDIKDL